MKNDRTTQEEMFKSKTGSHSSEVEKILVLAMVLKGYFIGGWGIQSVLKAQKYSFFLMTEWQ